MQNASEGSEKVNLQGQVRTTEPVGLANVKTGPHEWIVFVSLDIADIYPQKMGIVEVIAIFWSINVPSGLQGLTPKWQVGRICLSKE